MHQKNILERIINQKVRDAEPALWLNPNLSEFEDVKNDLPISPADVIAAKCNWKKLTPLFECVFESLSETKGVIESDLIKTQNLQNALKLAPNIGSLYVKADHDLPVAGSIKARGGLYEVFMYAWSLAKKAGLISNEDATTRLLDSNIRNLFSQHKIAVGSTGNLGLSIGLGARALGFLATVHMSSDAKEWKIKRLRDIGVEVIQYEADYGTAVEKARVEAIKEEKTYFVDDERSELLFHGYSVAANYLDIQLKERGITVDAENPLFIYLPCGIGGAPGGIAYGAKMLFGRHVHCFFVEPTQSPCALVQLMHGIEMPISVYDFGLTNKTEADGMAVAQVSQFVARIMDNLLSGVFTVSDDDLYRWLHLGKTTEDLKLEPSAASCFAGPGFLTQTPEGMAYQKAQGLVDVMRNSTHILWTTGGSFVPDDQYHAFFEKGRQLNALSTNKKNNN